MKSRLLIATTAVAALAGGSAYAQCDQRIQGMQQQHGEFFIGGGLGFEQGRPVLRDLRDAAFRLQQQGLEEACESVVDAMEQTIAAYEVYGDQAGAATMAPADTTVEGAARTGVVGGTTATRGVFTPEEIQARSVPLSQSDISMNTDEMQNRDIYSFNGEDLGDFEGLLISQGQPTHIVVSHGGFFSIGDDDVAIPVDMVSWDPEWQVFVVPFTEDQLDEAPDYNRTADWDVTGNDEYWGQFRG